MLSAAHTIVPNYLGQLTLLVGCGGLSGSGAISATRQVPRTCSSNTNDMNHIPPQSGEAPCSEPIDETLPAYSQVLRRDRNLTILVATAPADRRTSPDHCRTTETEAH